LMFRRMVGAVESYIAPDFGCCGTCHRPWNRVETHTVYFERGHGCFALCEWCWAHSSLRDRLRAHASLWGEWYGEERPQQTEPMVEWELVKQAVSDAMVSQKYRDSYLYLREVTK
jgi:hypothetical protein